MTQPTLTIDAECSDTIAQLIVEAEALDESYSQAIHELCLTIEFLSAFTAMLLPAIAGGRG